MSRPARKAPVSV